MLAAQVYGNLALREYGDLDIVIRRREDVARAHRLLLAQGYQAPERLAPLYWLIRPIQVGAFAARLNARAAAQRLRAGRGATPPRGHH